MIQRIQTLWLLVAAVILLGLFVFPFVSFIDLVGLGKQIYVKGIYSANNNDSVRESSSIMLAIYAGIVTIAPLLIVFQYKNRKRQILFIIVERSEEHTSELQSRENLVCRLLLEKKNKNKSTTTQL